MLFLGIFLRLQPLVSAMSLTLRCFVFALRLRYSVSGSLFLHWTFFICAITSSVSGCFEVLLLWSGTRLDLRFFLSDGVARWDVSLLFLFAPCLILRLFRQALVGCSLFFLLVSVSEFSLVLPLFAWLRSALSIGGCRSLPVFCVFLLVRPS